MTLTFIIFLTIIVVDIGAGIGIMYSYIKDAPPLNMKNFQYIESSIILDINEGFYQQLQ
ncbi:hypothetical protein [Garciella nitratireducens]|uniref:hypothetical protein n=1 Tax=Garciella nitratireducens TaxID=218205 RepID=UPI001BD2057D|nr:hypothetical protein [Garciella nitratireducens]